jgi:two-component system alkaline phosphatase synthesis response regulator PhoP
VATPATILVVDDEKDILEFLSYNLEKEGYRVLQATTGTQALKLAERLPQLVVLDVMLPEMDGWEVCRALRVNPKTAHIPIVFLTARDSEIDEVVGLELGAQDYITKPVRVRTLLARVKRILRENGRHEIPQEVIRAGEIEIHAHNYLVKVGKKEVFLPKKEFEVLLYLARHPDRVVSRETLLNEIWGTDVYVVDRTVDVHIRKIREKLDRCASHIETVKGVGYRFRKEP